MKFTRTQALADILDRIENSDIQTLHGLVKIVFSSPFPHCTRLRSAAMEEDGVNVLTGSFEQAGLMPYFYEWAVQKTIDLCAGELSRVTRQSSGLHFNAKNLSGSQITGFSMKNIVNTYQRCTPTLWRMIQTLLNVNHTTRHIAPNDDDSESPFQGMQGGEKILDGEGEEASSESFSEGDDSEGEDGNDVAASLSLGGNQAQARRNTVKQSNKMDRHKKRRAAATLQVVSGAFLIVDTQPCQLTCVAWIRHRLNSRYEHKPVMQCISGYPRLFPRVSECT